MCNTFGLSFNSTKKKEMLQNDIFGILYVEMAQYRDAARFSNPGGQAVMWWA